jgi:pimeloyl-ACP methyl ester carboxylesterase
LPIKVVGEGSLDLVFLPEWVNNLEMQWQDPRLARFPTRLASFSRVVMLNMRGIGLSDALPQDDSPAIEHWIDDITAVLEALAANRVALLGTGIGGSLALVFAATYPERVSAIVLVNATARSSAAPDYPFGIGALPPMAVDAACVVDDHVQELDLSADPGGETGVFLHDRVVDGHEPNRVVPRPLSQLRDGVHTAGLVAAGDHHCPTPLSQARGGEEPDSPGCRHDQRSWPALALRRRHRITSFREPDTDAATAV